MAALALLTLTTAGVQTAVVPALPSIQRELGASTTGVTWALTVTALLFAVSTPIVGRLGDIFGRQRMLLFVATTASLGCLVSALSHSLGLLVAGRTLQGLGGSSFSLAFAVVRDEVPPARRTQAFGAISATYGIGAVAAYPLSGVVVDHLSYAWIFWFGLIGFATSGVAVRRLVPTSPVVTPAPVDWAGGVLFTVGVACVMLGISEGVHWGWSSGPVLGLLGGGAACLAAWWWWELRTRDPLVDARLLRGARSGR